MNDYCPGAVQSPQPGGGGTNAALPPRVTWHITWDALRADGSQPQFSAVSDYLKNQGYCPTIMWNPFTGYMEQFYPASQSARALVAWNEDGAPNIQVEVFFTPGCVVDGIRYETVADTPLIGFDTLLEWMDGFGIPRVWPMGAPQWQGNSRDPGIWNSQAGHYGHCNVPDNTHTDPGPMPDLNRGGIAAMGTTTTPEEDMANVSDEQLNFMLAALTSLVQNVATKKDIKPIADSVVPPPGRITPAIAAAWSDYNRDLILNKVGTGAPAAGPASVDVEALVARLKEELPAASMAALLEQLSKK